MIPGFSKLQNVFKRTLNRVRNRVIILLYHRVINVDSDPQLLCVSPENFEEHLHCITRCFHPLTLENLNELLTDGKVPRNGVVLTFDDGYADNFLYAKPLLSRFGVPATVFVTAGYVGKSEEFWWDELESLLLSSPSLPENLELSLNGRKQQWHFRKEAERPLKKHPDFKGWNVLSSDIPTNRHQAYLELCDLLRPLKYEDREAALTDLRRQVNGAKITRESHRSLTFREIRQLNNDPVFEIGAHTITHSMLAKQTREVQQYEILESKHQLESILEKPVKSFSYPYGGKRDVDLGTADIVREAGFKTACANFAEPVTGRADPYFLPRFLVRNWDGEEFKKRLNYWFRE
jgi:peptidoglycan/xylan/chitin deacetylase (PgdA/CDA1 family)